MGYEEFIDAIKEAAELYATAEDDGALTLREWAKALGWTYQKTIKVFGMLKEDGKLEVSKVVRRSLDDSMHPVPAYRMVL